MKKWLQNLSGAVMASLLAVTLSSKAYANAEEPQTLPAEAPMQIVEPVAPAPVETVPAVAPVPAVIAPAAVEASAAEVQAAEIPEAEIPAAVPEASVTVSDASGAEIPGSEASVAPGIPTGELSADEPVTPAVEISDVVDDDRTDITVTPATAENVQQPVTETAQADESQPEEETALLNTPLPAPETRLLSKTSSPAVRGLPSLSKTQASADTLSVSGTEMQEQGEDRSEETGGEDAKAQTRGTGEGGEEDGGQTVTSVFTHNEDGSYTLVNHTGAEKLTADGDITVLAAGLNHISSISGSGTVRIAGTGILLVDSLEGNLELLTFTDIYDEGSAAVFVKDSSGRYVLRNGPVPGVLDEQYRVTDATLVMPANTSLLLCGTGAVPKNDGSGIVYYHGTDVIDGKTKGVISSQAVESTGKLTIAERAALIIEKGASIILENLRSLGGTESEDFTRRPELCVTDGGTIAVQGTVGNNGYVTLSGTSQTLSGSGSLSADRITVINPAAIQGSNVNLSSRYISLNGSGSVENLTVHDSTVIQENSGLSISGLTSSGKSMVVLNGGSNLRISKVEGTLSLRNGTSEESSVSGNIAGNGTIRFESGTYVLPLGTKLNNVKIASDCGGNVFDYAGVLDKSYSPLFIEPADVMPAGQNSGTIPVAAAMITEHGEMGVPSWVEIHQSLAAGTISAVLDDSNGWVLNHDTIQNAINGYKDELSSWSEGIVVVELLQVNGNHLSLTRYYPSQSTAASTGESNPDSNVAQSPISAADVCLVRILFMKETSFVAPDSPATQTGTLFTGSGILGGSGAGSLTIGNATQIINPKPDPAPNPRPDPTPNPKPDPAPDPKPDPDPVPLVLTYEETPDKPLVWAEVAPVVGADALSPAETQYVLLALEGEKTLEELGGKATVSMQYTLPAEFAGKPLYVVFRNEDGTLTAIRATYSKATGLLRFVTDRLGTFMLVGFDFDGDEFSDEFYAALEKLPGVENLAFAEYSPV